MRAKWGLSLTKVLMWTGLWERVAQNNPCEYFGRVNHNVGKYIPMEGYMKNKKILGKALSIFMTGVMTAGAIAGGVGTGI